MPGESTGLHANCKPLPLPQTQTLTGYMYQTPDELEQGRTLLVRIRPALKHCSNNQVNIDLTASSIHKTR